jgi:WD40 repeat protein
VPPDESTAPPAIPDYELLRLIGRGGYGDVWLARGVTGVFRAIKIVWRARFDDPQPYEREFRGLKEFAAVSLTESRQLALLHVGRHDAAGFFYYVMELADDVATGRDIDPARYVPHTLKEVRTRRGRLPAPEAVALGAELARALAGLHTRGLVHRDIKPSNIILVGGAPKLADIGLVASASAGLTFVGTEGYVPPEGPGAPAADVFALGKLLYELATGLDRHDYPRLPADLHTLEDRKELLELNEVLIRACEPNATKRHADATAMLDDLLLLQAGKSVRRLRNAERRVTRALRFAAVLAVIAGLAGAGAWVERKRAEDETKLRLAAEAERDAQSRKAAYSSGLERAQIAVENGELGRARILLNEVLPKDGAPDLRGFAWHALWREAQGDPAHVLRETGPAAQRLHVSADQRFIAGQDADLHATVWDATTQRQVARCPDVFALGGFSSDAKWLMGVNRKVGLLRWSTETGQPDGVAFDEGATNRPIAALGEHRLVCFRDSKNTAPHMVRVWDFSEQRDVLRAAVPRQADGALWDFYRPNAAAVTPDGKLCALVMISGRVTHARWKLTVQDLISGRIVFSETVPDRINAVAFSRDGTRLAVAIGNTAELQILDVTRGGWLWKRKTSRGPASILAFSPDGRLLAAGNTQVEVFRADSGEPNSHLRGNGAGVESLAWLPDGSSLVSAGTTGDIRLWRNLSGGPHTEIGGFWIPPGGGRKLCLSEDGLRLAATDTPAKGPLALGTNNAGVLGRGPAGWLPVAFLGATNEMIGLRPDGVMERRQVKATGDWPLREEARLFEGRVDLGSSAVLSGDGRVLVVGSTRGQVVFWDLHGARRLATVEAGNTALGFVAVSRDGRHALTGGSSRSHARLWDVASGERRKQIALPAAQPLCGAFSNHGSRLALGWADGSVQVHDVTTGDLVRRIRSHSLVIQSIAFTPDDAEVVCGAPNGNVHVFALEDGREVITLRAAAKAEGASDSRASNLAFSADGAVLAAYLNDGRIRLWRR